MMLIYQYRIYRQDIQANPNLLYIFGDNLDRVGMGGQAKEMRGEPNAFGIATKRAISHSYPRDYFFDHEIDARPILEKEFERLHEILKQEEFEAIVLPLEGIGTGLARLPTNAPKLLEYINSKLIEPENL